MQRTLVSFTACHLDKLLLACTSPKVMSTSAKHFLIESKHILLIQVIHSGGRFFSSYPKPDTLDTLSEAPLYYGSEKSEHCQR